MYLQFEDRIIPSNLGTGMVQMKGTPVSNGSIKARVCVSEDITEADNIQVLGICKTNYV